MLIPPISNHLIRVETTSSFTFYMLCGEVSYEASVRRNIACGEPGLCAPHTALKTTLHTCPLPFFGSRTIELTFWFSTIVRFYTVWVVALVEKNSKKSWPNQSKRRLSAELLTPSYARVVACCDHCCGHGSSLGLCRGQATYKTTETPLVQTHV